MLSRLSDIEMKIDSILPIIVMVLDFSINAIVFNSNHCVLVLLFLAAYFLTNYLVTYFSQQPVYDFITWKDKQTAWLLLIQAAVVLGCFFIFYFVSRLKNKKFSKTSDRRRQTLKER